MKIDYVDSQILKQLCANSRLSIRELAKKVNLSAPSVAERVRKLEDEGVIEGYTTKINYEKLGYTINAILEVTIRNGQSEKFKQYIERHPRAVFCYRVAGPACYMLKISVRHLQEIEEFINSVSELAQTVTHIVFSSVDVKDNLLTHYEIQP
jgi:Lrp/AsnC family leucine-responsive transcriptional regulator